MQPRLRSPLAGRAARTLGRVARVGALAVAVGRFARRPVATPAADPAEAPARCGDVTVVIPARDEAARIGPCLDSVRDQCARVLVVDDGSTDETAAVARRHGAEVIEAGTLPVGWAGKAHALAVGIAAAATPSVVCLDADTRCAPDAVEALVGMLGDRVLLTAGTRVDAPDQGERWVHPSLLTTLVYRFGRPGTRVGPDRLLANGQCMVLDRTRFLATGGLEPVRHHLIEDVALARSLAARGHSVGFVDGGALVTVAGYGSLAAAWRGWGRSLDLGEVTSRRWQAADLAVVWLAMALPLPRLMRGRGDGIDVAALAIRLGVLTGTRRSYVHGGPAYWLSPLADVLVAARLSFGMARPARTWRGRTYPAR